MEIGINATRDLSSVLSTDRFYVTRFTTNGPPFGARWTIKDGPRLRFEGLESTSLPAACGADTGSPARNRRTAAGGSFSIPGISLSRNQRCASGCEMDVLLALVLAPSLGSSPCVTRPQSSCISSAGWSYLVPAQPPVGSLLPAPDTRRRPTPCAPRRGLAANTEPYRAGNARVCSGCGR